jgi:two-component system NtrC family response regulator
MPEGTILVIDDEEFLRQAVARTLELEGYTVLQAANAYHGLAALRDHAAEVLVVLSDVKLPDGRGLDLLPRYKALAPLAEVILLTAYGTIADSVQAMKNGAFDYLTKSDADEQLVVIVDRAADKARLQRRVADLEQKVGAQYSPGASQENSPPSSAHRCHRAARRPHGRGQGTVCSSHSPGQRAQKQAFRSAQLQCLPQRFA